VQVSVVTVPTELTTAATDLLLGLVCVVLAVRLWTRGGPPWRRVIWGGVLGMLALGSFLGAAAHGLVVPPVVRTYFWQRIYLSLGMALGLVVVGALFDWRGEGVARRALPWAAAAAFACFVVLELVKGGFAVFLIAEALAMLTALAIYVHLWRAGQCRGAAHVIAGIVLSLAAAGVQVSRAHVTAFGWPFDHNSLFHLAQIAATLVLAAGVRQGMGLSPGRASNARRVRA
jgi:hypothetical protein